MKWVTSGSFSPRWPNWSEEEGVSLRPTRGSMWVWPIFMGQLTHFGEDMSSLNKVGHTVLLIWKCLESCKLLHQNGRWFYKITHSWIWSSIQCLDEWWSNSSLSTKCRWVMVLESETKAWSYWPTWWKWWIPIRKRDSSQCLWMWKQSHWLTRAGHLRDNVQSGSLWPQNVTHFGFQHRYR
jgi:hypothetical protein